MSHRRSAASLTVAAIGSLTLLDARICRIERTRSR
jgi:hypothetical protein